MSSTHRQPVSLEDLRGCIIQSHDLVDIATDMLSALDRAGLSDDSTARCNQIGSLLSVARDLLHHATCRAADNALAARGERLAS
jgi:hypothetical protein